MLGYSSMAQWVKELVTTSDKLSSIPGTKHNGRREHIS